MASLLFDTNLSLYTIPAAWVIAIIPHVWASAQSKTFDNRSPRQFHKALESDQKIDQAINFSKKDQITRAEAAQQNGFENIALFASAVVAGNVAGLSSSSLNILSLGYLVSRVAYTFIYINNTSLKTSNARTAVFLFGIGQIFTLFIKSGNALRNAKNVVLG